MSLLVNFLFLDLHVVLDTDPLPTILVLCQILQKRVTLPIGEADRREGTVQALLRLYKDLATVAPIPLAGHAVQLVDLPVCIAVACTESGVGLGGGDG